MSKGSDISDNGKSAITPYGFYTFVHYYFHPTRKCKVVMVGMQHYADEGYFQKIKELLSPCDLVLYEEMSPERVAQDMTKEKAIRLLRKEFAETSLDARVFRIWRHFALIVDHYLLGIPYEGHVFSDEFQQPHWIHADIFFWDNGKNVAQEQELRLVKEWIKGLPPEQKERAVRDFLRIIEDIELGRFIKRDLRKATLLSNLVPYEIVTEAFMVLRDLHCFETFDRYVETHNPEFVGIKYGDSHMPGQRLLIEERGYVKQKSIRIRSIDLRS